MMWKKFYTVEKNIKPYYFGKLLYNCH